MIFGGDSGAGKMGDIPVTQTMYLGMAMRARIAGQT
jgi:hypothetical protein